MADQVEQKPENSLKRNSEIKTIDPVRPDQQVIEQAADIVKNGGIVIFPTRTLYGMGVDAFNENAVSRVFCFKQRAVDKPLSVLVSTIDAVAALAADIPDVARRLMQNFWPGRLTIVFSAWPDVPGG
ncbi:MAG: L-threonylcarbamoyladenylate synthase [Desulfobacterales bacterium]